MTSPISLTVSPAAIRVHGPGTQHERMTVTNNGSSPLAVHPAAVRVDPGHGCTEAPPAWLRVTTGDFTLPAHGHRDIAFTVHGQGSGQAAVIAVASVKSARAQKIAGTVGERVTLNSGRQSCTVAHVPVHRAPAATGSVPWAWVAVAAVVAVLAFGLAWRTWKNRA